ncbi:MAG: flagellin [Phenylobacterium sp.]|uniref:flagellin n=1 Tax=Phenylobacterium sp. TaxID=1871053 RepID=UPI00271F8B3B|nr:flagellin [Phenylobacterium sp.]MDO9432826.1 flagellin [Phenylobacterium sp.]
MSVSINTNRPAPIPLQNLANDKRDQVQNKADAALGVVSAEPAVYSTAQKQRAEFSSLSAVKTSLDRASSITDVALAAGQQVGDILNQMREKAVGAADDSTSPTSRAAFDGEYQALLQSISQLSASAKFDGVSMLNGTLTSNLNVVGSADGEASISLTPQDLTVGGSVINLAGTALTGTTRETGAVLAAVDRAIVNVSSALAELDAQSKQIEKHGALVTKLENVLDTGIGKLVDGDIAKESARLQALQVRQQLGPQALSIANSQPELILQLFRGGA